MKYITIHLMGGLGNQLFQIFTTIAYAIKHNLRVIFEYSTELRSGITRPTYWNSFLKNIENLTTKNPEYSSVIPYLNRFVTIKESGFHYTPIPALANINYLKLFGYFQSYKYFKEEFEQISKMILLQEQKDMVKGKYTNLFNTTYNISMHFRYGDYRAKEDCHPCLRINYYIESINKILFLLKGKKDNLQILYFCEKTETQFVNKMIEQLKVTFPFILFTKADDNIADYEQLLIMSLCNANIIANSSFSLWGAFFNTMDNNIVCYPHLWFGPKLGSYNTKDMYHEKWHKIEFVNNGMI